jgi:hypothetical protein
MTALPPPDASARVHDRFAVTVGAGAAAPVPGDGAPTAEEMAAILAAVEHLWPRPVVVLDDERTRETAAWRFSGRWWSRPTVTRRDRPWVR